MDAEVAGVMSARLDPLLASASTTLTPPANPPKQPERIGSLPSLRDAIFVIQQQQQPELLLATLPYAQLLGMKAFYQEGELVLHLPTNKSNIGNPTLPALHGGAIAGFMEMSAVVHLLMSMESVRIPRVVDFSIDYVRAGRLEDTYVSCSVVRQGNKLVNVAITAWQQDRHNPIATARAHFLVD
ncbi:PaaI family thioesterase [Motiliproteus coralliicola]|uniref:PaaI family thioesterase n=2 Tax=Motiliproteus coralliicola TaxID=2283196 RepID=A0A369WR51_9GAMM|nr:PaaI family thioesterase [Motiliproteus coralliicola]